VNEEIKGIVDRWLAANPGAAHGLGIHRYDGRLPNFSLETISLRLQQIQGDLYKVDTLLQKAGDKVQQFERTLIRYSLLTEKFRLTEEKAFEDNPLEYIFPLAIVETSYASRSFDTIEKRIESIISIENAIPQFLNTAVENLNEKLSTVKVSMSIQFLKGILSYFKDRLIAFVVQTDDEILIEKWSQTNIMACDALSNFLDKLENEYLPKSTSEFKLGEEKFLKMLNMTENVDLDVDTLLKIGEEDLERNYNKMRNLLEMRGADFLQKVRSDHSSVESLLNDARGGLDRTRDWLTEGDIVDLPTDRQCEVIDTPEFARSFGFAAMNTPGPFESPEASEAYYWVTPPDNKWPKEKQEEFLQFFSRGFMETVTIHEVWPGHYLQLLYNRESKSEISKIFARSITMIEGWAHYCEEMIYESGYAPFDRDILHAGQLMGALIRNCRYIAAVKMHCRDMSVEEAKELFMRKGFMSEPTATIEARRGTVNPMYLNYSLGKFLIKKLREDYKNEQGSNFSLKKFHNLLLSYGSPPIVALRKLLIENQNAALL